MRADAKLLQSSRQLARSPANRAIVAMKKSTASIAGLVLAAVLIAGGCSGHRATREESIADALDAMTSDRPYRKALPLEIALDEIGNNAPGSKFARRAGFEAMAVFSQTADKNAIGGNLTGQSWFRRVGGTHLSVQAFFRAKARNLSLP